MVALTVPSFDWRHAPGQTCAGVRHGNALPNSIVSLPKKLIWNRPEIPFSTIRVHFQADSKAPAISADAKYGMITEKLIELVRASVTEVFTTMLDISVQPVNGTEIRMNGDSHVVGSVGFIGSVTGVVFIYSTDAFASTMTNRLLGFEPGETVQEDMVNDAIGELTNMVVGHIKARLPEGGSACALTIPSIVRGNHLSIEPVKNSDHVLVSFQCHHGDHVVIKVLLKTQ